MIPSDDQTQSWGNVAPSSGIWISEITTTYIPAGQPSEKKDPCEYCRSLHGLTNCPNCGAPKSDRRTFSIQKVETDTYVAHYAVVNGVHRAWPLIVNRKTLPEPEYVERDATFDWRYWVSAFFTVLALYFFLR